MLIARAERVRAEAEGMTPRALSEVDLLLGVRDDLREGALRFRLDDEPYFRAAEDSGVPVLTDLPALLDIAARAESDGAGYDELRQLIRAGSSLGGARPKAHVINASGHVAIAKFPSGSSDTWNVMAWEKVALDLARAAGLTVENSQLIRVADRHVLIADRFDRRGSARIGYASAMTMLEARPGEQRSYLEIAEVIEERSPAATRELRELWRRIAFSVLISNTDDHLRNHGFLHERGESWTLSPAFDVNPNPAPGPKYLSTAIDFTDTRASVDTLMSVASYFRLDEDAALVVLAEVTNAVAGWRDVAKSHGLTNRDIDMMQPAFVHPEAERARDLIQPR
jgi:serine/threonine-protein kinase HipA